MNLTHHAIEQYQRRVRPELTSHVEAKRELMRQAARAEKIGDPTRTGEQKYACPDGAVLIASWCPRVRKLVAKTCYPPHYANGSTSRNALDAIMRTQFRDEALAGPVIVQEAPTQTNVPRESVALSFDRFTSAREITGPAFNVCGANAVEAAEWVVSARLRIDALSRMPYQENVERAIKMIESRIRHVEQWMAANKV